MIPENMLLLPKAQPHRTAQTDPVRNTVTEHTSMGTNNQQRFQEAAQAEEQAAQKEKGMDSEPPKTSKLEFTADELPPEPKDKKLTHARRRAERTAQKAEQAQDRLPARKKLRMETVSDPETGKAKKHLKFEKEGQIPKGPCKRTCTSASGQGGRQYCHWLRS